VKPITDRERAMHRVVADTAWVQGNVVSPQAFLPRPQDEGKLSLLDMGQDAPAALATWRTAFPKSKAGSTLTHPAGAYLALEVPLTETPGRLPTHCTADFTGLSAEGREIVAALLAEDLPSGPERHAHPIAPPSCSSASTGPDPPVRLRGGPRRPPMHDRHDLLPARPVLLPCLARRRPRGGRGVPTVCRIPARKCVPSSASSACSHVTTTSARS
jgi:hypothetical protein